MPNLKHNWESVKMEYQDWRSNDFGSDGEFLMKKHPEIGIAGFRRMLKRWREDSKNKFPTKINLKEPAMDSGQSWETKDENGAEEGGTQKLALSYLLPLAKQIYAKSLSTGKIGVTQLKTARDILEAHGQLGKRDTPKDSGFSSWSTEMLTEFILTMQDATLATRKVALNDASFVPVVEPEQYDDPARDDSQPLQTTQIRVSDTKD